jgi:DNA repair photolyase
MLATSEVKEIIWNVLSEDIEDGANRKKLIANRQKKIRESIGSFNRDAYRKILNNEIRLAFYRLVDGVETIDDVNLLRSVEFGTKQWSDESFNIMLTNTLCPNACLYCYITALFNKNSLADIKAFFKKYREMGLQIIGDGEIKGRDRLCHRMKFTTDPEKAAKSWTTRGKRKLFMSPTSHDVFPENVKELVAAWKRMLSVDHHVLIVSKPLLECVKYICEELADYKDKVTFRFTLTSDIQSILDVLEPLAPLFDERLECLRYAIEAGFETSVSIEPFLSDPVSTVKKMEPFVTGEIWIGCMNGFPSEKIIGIPFTDRENKIISKLKEVEYSFKNVTRIVKNLRSNKKIQWKESIIKMYLKYRGH